MANYNCFKGFSFLRKLYIDGDRKHDNLVPNQVPGSMKNLTAVTVPGTVPGTLPGTSGLSSWFKPISYWLYQEVNGNTKKLLVFNQEDISAK